jgi:hypothetical protein
MTTARRTLVILGGLLGLSALCPAESVPTTAPTDHTQIPKPAAVMDIEAARATWAFSLPKDHPLPHVREVAWCKSPIDWFILAKLDEKGLRPAPPADKRTLIRRASFDLIGLPPTPSEVDAFLADDSPEAFAKVIDRLLASPHYGERWGRHWLDVVRYADAFDSRSVQGDHIGAGDISEAWRYRDWVVNAFNNDLPYDQFIMNQLAGDLLSEPEGRQINRDGLIATTMYVIGNWPVGDADKEKMMADIVDDQIDVTGRAFLGVTLACARCHDHKFDPISQKDYYALAGIFFSSHILPSPGVKTAGSPVLQVPLVGTEVVEPRKKFEAAVAEIQKKLAALGSKSESREKRSALQAELEKLKQTEPPAYDTANAINEGGVPQSQYEGVHDWYVLARGQYDRKGELVPRGFPRLLTGDHQVPITHGSGRIELARWIASPANPMTAKVLVNRIWQHHFGAGIVRTPNNFGKLGEEPSHPELLDWLALRFVDAGWSIKRMHRLIMLSAAYQQASEGDPQTMKADPGNRWFGRMNRQRLEAEPLRDAMLAVSGTLDRSMGGPATRTLSTGRRTLYLMTIRSDRSNYRMLFDAADPTAIADHRIDSTVAPQSLFLMNDPFVLDKAAALATRTLAQPLADDRARIDWLYQLLFGRRAKDYEIAVARSALEGRSSDAWQQYCQLLLCTNEFTYVD